MCRGVSSKAAMASQVFKVILQLVGVVQSSSTTSSSSSTISHSRAEGRRLCWLLSIEVLLLLENLLGFGLEGKVCFQGGQQVSMGMQRGSLLTRNLQGSLQGDYQWQREVQEEEQSNANRGAKRSPPKAAGLQGSSGGHSKW